MMRSLNELFKTQVLPAIILSLVILLVFGNLPKTFYQQDEWYSFGRAPSKGLGKYLMTADKKKLIKME